jgi:hypothetical protein
VELAQKTMGGRKERKIENNNKINPICLRTRLKETCQHVQNG